MTRQTRVAFLLFVASSACSGSASSNGTKSSATGPFVGVYSVMVTTEVTSSGQVISTDNSTGSATIENGTHSDLVIRDPDCDLKAHITGTTTFDIVPTDCPVADPSGGPGTTVSTTGKGSVVNGHLTLDVSSTFTVRTRSATTNLHIEGDRPGKGGAAGATAAGASGA